MSEAQQDRFRISADQLLGQARCRLDRLSPERAHAAMLVGALLIDIRSEVQRERDGVVPGSRFIPRNVLEWRCDPVSRWRDEAVSDAGARIILICSEGYQSSLAAATLQQLGHFDATDVIGGFQAWEAAGLPVRPAQIAGPTSDRSRGSSVVREDQPTKTEGARHEHDRDSG
jgi:rhodanese-related sulfurtransferase